MDDIIKDLKKLDTKHKKMKGGFLGALAGLLAPVIGQALGLGKSGGYMECDDDKSSVSSISDMEEEMTLKRIPKRKHKKAEKGEEGKGKSGGAGYGYGAGKSGAGKADAGKSGAGRSGAGKAGAGKSGGKKRPASPWAMLVKKVMKEQKIKSMKDAIAHIKANDLYKK